MKNLDVYGVQELDAEEKVVTNGGFIHIIGAIAGIVITHIVTEIVFNPEAHTNAWNEGKADAMAAKE